MDIVLKSLNTMHQVNIEIWTLYLVARKTLTRIYKKGHNLHKMQDRVIVLDNLHRCDKWVELYKVSIQCIK